MVTDRRRGLALGIGAMLFFSFDALSIRLSQIEIATLICLRSLLGAAVVALLMICFRQPVTLRGTSWLAIAIFAAATAIAQASFVLSVGATAAINTLVIISAAPLFSAALSVVFLSERIPRHTLVAVLVVPAAPLLVFLSGPTPGLGVGHEGQWYALLCMVASSAGWVVARRFADTNISVAVCLGNLMCGLFFLPQVELAAVTALDWAAILYGGLAVVGLAFYMLYFAARLVHPAEMSLLILIELSLAPLILWLAVDERPAAGALAAGALVGAVFIVHTFVAVRRAAPAQP